MKDKVHPLRVDTSQDSSMNAVIDFIDAAYFIATIDDIIDDEIRDQGALTRIQDKVAIWIAHGYDHFLPMVHAETIISALTNNVDEGKQTKSSKPSTLFRKLVRDMKNFGILDSGTTGYFLQKRRCHPNRYTIYKVGWHA